MSNVHILTIDLAKRSFLVCVLLREINWLPLRALVGSRSRL